MTTLLTASDLELHYNHKYLLNKVNFVLDNREVIGLVGRNGCGKTSLLKIIASELDFDGGKLEFKKGAFVGYLPQDFEIQSILTIKQYLDEATEWITDLVVEYESLKVDNQQKHDLLEIISSHHGFDLQVHLRDLCNRFEVDLDSKKPISAFSGGEQRRIALVGALLGYPEILIVDEPTNHLDLRAIETLEKIIKAYQGVVLIVSHDRYFLDNVVTRMWELWQGQFFVHTGGYSKYLENKAIRLEIENSTDWKKQQYLKRELEWVRAGVKARSTKDKGRLKRFYDLKDTAGIENDLSVEMILPEPKPQGARILEVEKTFLDIKSTKSDSKTLSTTLEQTIEEPKMYKNSSDSPAQSDSKILQSKNLVHNFTFSFQPGQKIGVIGNNGAGKTSFLKMLMGQVPASKGTVKIGINTEFLYFDQTKVSLKPSKTPFEILGDGNERMDFGQTQVSVRKYLEAWLFDRQKYNTTVKHLSGGEKSRLVLAKILAQGGNFLVLDEPTNDLDLDTLRVLEESLVNFEGTAMIVSHDRYFLNRVCNYIFAFEGNGAILICTGNYDNYLTKTIDPMLVRSYREELRRKEKEQKQKQKDTKSEIQKLEFQIEKIENKLLELKEPFEDPDFYIKQQARSLKLHKLISDWEKELRIAMEKWEVLSSEQIVISEIVNSTVEFEDFIIKPPKNTK